jgi:hypothetical protein
MNIIKLIVFTNIVNKNHSICILKRDLLLRIKIIQTQQFFVKFDSESIYSQIFIIKSDINDKCSQKSDKIKKYSHIKI